jgi:4-hydroxybenzoate polyprenyltransferase
MIKKILKIIRFQNLLFIILIQYLMRYCIIGNYLKDYNLNLLFSNFNFALLVLATILTAAAGYIINDSFDYERDKIAQRETIIGKDFSQDTALKLFIILNLIAIVIGFYISFAINFYKLGIIFILISGLLWFYSQSYKKSLLFGNFIIALLAALVPLITLPYEILLQYDINKEQLFSIGINLNKINYTILAFSAYAFILTFIREIIKDIEDEEADSIYDYRTLPITTGIKTAKQISSALTILTAISVIYFTFKYLNINSLQIIYTSIFVIIPLIFLSLWLLKAKNQKDFHKISIFTKIIMLTGVLLSIIICI